MWMCVYVCTHAHKSRQSKTIYYNSNMRILNILINDIQLRKNDIYKAYIYFSFYIYYYKYQKNDILSPRILDKIPT